MRTTLAILVSIAFVSFSAQGATTKTSTLKTTQPANWVVEGALQIHSVSERGKLMIGSSLSYLLTENGQVGVRALLPMENHGTYSILMYWRQNFGEKVTRLYFEPGAGFNIVNDGTETVPSAGLSFGVNHRLNETIHIGGSAGFEGYLEPIDGVARAKIGELRLTPKMLLHMNFLF